MHKKITYVTQPFLPPLEEYIPYLEEIWQNKILTNCGPYHQEFEKKLCQYFGVNQISLFSSGASALNFALQSLGMTGEVITTPFSFVATSHSLLFNHLTPVFVDIDPLTLNLDPMKIETAITDQTKAILAVHCYGHPCDVVAIAKIAETYHLKVIYDAAHAFGVECENGSVLAFGDLSVLSFHATKVFNTFEGGAVVCSNGDTKRHLDCLKNFGLDEESKVVFLGGNGKMSEINAAFGLLQLKYVNEAIEKRRLIDLTYRARLKEVRGIYCVKPTSEVVSNYSYFPILINDDYPLNRDDLYEKLKSNGYFARRYFYPLISDSPLYVNYPSASRDNLPNASNAANRILCLPIYPDLSDDAVEKICNLIDES